MDYLQYTHLQVRWSGQEEKKGRFVLVVQKDWRTFATASNYTLIIIITVKAVITYLVVMNRMLVSFVALLMATFATAQTAINPLAQRDRHSWQPVQALEQLKAEPMKAYGGDYPYQWFSRPQTKAPKGYKPFYVSHYSRHGSRYYWTDHLYKDIDTLMTIGHNRRHSTRSLKKLKRNCRQAFQSSRRLVGNSTKV